MSCAVGAAPYLTRALYLYSVIHFSHIRLCGVATVTSQDIKKTSSLIFLFREFVIILNLSTLVGSAHHERH